MSETRTDLSGMSLAVNSIRQTFINVHVLVCVWNLNPSVYVGLILCVCLLRNDFIKKVTNDVINPAEYEI